MTTRQEVLDAIARIEKAGLAGELTRAAQLDVLLLPPQDYERILARLRSAYPQLVPPPVQPQPAPPEQQGAGVRAMKSAESRLALQQSATAEFDRQVIEAILHAHKTTQDGRRQLDELATQIENAARTWDLSSAAGAREFQRFLTTKLDQIVRVVEEANDDDASKQALAAAWTALYAAQGEHDAAAAAAGDAAGRAGPSDDDELGAAIDDGDPDSYPEPLPDTEMRRTAAPASGSPAAPGYGAMPGAEATPLGGLPGGFPLAGLSPGRLGEPAPRFDDGATADPVAASEPGAEPADEPAGEPDAEEITRDTADAATTVQLPDGDTVRVASPRLAAAIQAAVGGTPIGEAFRRQGIAIPPPGTPVAASLDQSRVGPGDIGMFTDRQALALGNGKALLDGQIQQIGNVRGPSFLGWQHPPTETETSTPTPTPTRPSASVRT